MGPSVCHHGVAVGRQEGTDPCSAGKGSSPSRVQMVQSGQFLAVLTRDWSSSKAIGDASLWDRFSSVARACSPLWLATAAFFGCILVFPMLLLFPLWRDTHLWGGGVPQHGVLHLLKHNFRSVSFLSQAIRPVWVLKCFLGFISSASSCPGVLTVSSAGAEMMGRRNRCSPSSQATSRHCLQVSGVLASSASQVPAAFSS